MKRIIISLVLIIITLPVLAITVMPSLKFNNVKYSLYYSSKSPETGGFINEYYKFGETYENWTELIAVHHYPNEYSPIDLAKSMSAQLNSMNFPNTVMANDNANSAIIDFMLIDSAKIPIIVEFNIFKYEKNSTCGTSAIQYARRYFISDLTEIGKLRNFFRKKREKYINKITSFKIPELITDKIERGEYIKNEGIIPENIKGLD